MTERTDMPSITWAERLEAETLSGFCRAVLTAAGCDAPSAEAATRAMMHGSRLGVDSHGVRLLPHYAEVVARGRVKGRPSMRFIKENGAAAALDADHGHGALAAYTAMEHAVQVAGYLGIGAVAIRNTSHFGPAGAYAYAAAEAGAIGLAFCNSDSFVRLHEGAQKFHGTNPIAVAVPIEGERPWLLDMATSAISYNRVLLYRSLGRALPQAAASGGSGADTLDANAVEMLAPLGAAFGFKGAGLAGLAEIFSAILSGMRLSVEIPPMRGPDMVSPRVMGAFVMAMRPSAFVDQVTFQNGMKRYLAALRGSRSIDGGKVMAPGDREWEEEARRRVLGIPIDPHTAAAFDMLAERFSITRPRPLSKELARETKQRERNA
ncbi:Ldh family oxidoreductase [Dongia deserti]|uniref:Ldh family oxidoreductase n=1 Tax=Dongia deserti TaxID=2268030 RepID=UPI000E656AF2|nr:Ldh family oxidoreductase [Dongia deserti]